MGVRLEVLKTLTVFTEVQKEADQHRLQKSVGALSMGLRRRLNLEDSVHFEGII